MRGGIEAYVKAALPVARRIVARERLEAEQRRPLFTILDEAMSQENGDTSKVAARLGVDVACIDGWLAKQKEVLADPAEQESWDRSYFARMTEINASEAAATRSI